MHNEGLGGIVFWKCFRCNFGYGLGKFGYIRSPSWQQLETCDSATLSVRVNSKRYGF